MRPLPGSRLWSVAVLAIGVFAAAIARGDVVTSVTGSKLLVTGDESPDTITIEPAPEGITVRGAGGTRVDGSTAGVTIAGVSRLDIRLKGGADRLTVTQATFSDGIFLRLGDGDDGVLLDRVDGGTTRIRTGDGSDWVRVEGPSRVRSLSALTNRGRDFLWVYDVWVTGDLYVDTGSDDDDVTIFFAEIGGDAGIYLGSDEDILVLDDVWVHDDTDLDGDDGEDWLYLYDYIWFDDYVEIDGFGDDWWW